MESWTIPLLISLAAFCLAGIETYKLRKELSDVGKQLAIWGYFSIAFATSLASFGLWWIVKEAV